MASRNPLGNLFGRSPIGPIQEHMQIATEAAEHLPELIQAAADNDWTRAKEIHKAIIASEKEADKLKKKLLGDLLGGSSDSAAEEGDDQAEEEPEDDLEDALKKLFDR